MDERIKEIAKKFLRLKPTKIGNKHIVIKHPFSKNGYEDYKGKLVSIVDNQQAFRNFVEKYDGYIDDEDEITELMAMLTRSYIMTFVKFTEKYMTVDELSDVMATYWTEVEDISNDCNVSSQDIVRWLKQCNKLKLMTQEELAVYNNLPNIVTIYRGVTDHNRQNDKAMSWTTDRATAEWFARRYNGTGEVWEKKISKNKILWYNDQRDEHECIVDWF